MFYLNGKLRTKFVLISHRHFISLWLKNFPSHLHFLRCRPARRKNVDDNSLLEEGLGRLRVGWQLFKCTCRKKPTNRFFKTRISCDFSDKNSLRLAFRLREECMSSVHCLRPAGGSHKTGCHERADEVPGGVLHSRRCQERQFSRGLSTSLQLAQLMTFFLWADHSGTKPSLQGLRGANRAGRRNSSRYANEGTFFERPERLARRRLRSA